MNFGREKTISEAKMAHVEAKASKARAKALRPWYKKKRFIFAIVFVIIVTISIASNSGQSSNSPGSSTSITDEKPVEHSSETPSQKNAREAAERYLSVSSFSKSGLGKQLKFEGYDKSSINYALEAIEVDWNEQAAESAARYLEVSPFSHSSLVKQLKFDGFTTEQAEFGTKKSGL
jgi:hypothetical protein